MTGPSAGGGAISTDRSDQMRGKADHLEEHVTLFDPRANLVTRILGSQTYRANISRQLISHTYHDNLLHQLLMC